MIRLLPHEQIHHQHPQPTPLPQNLIHRNRIVRRRHTIPLLTQPPRLIHDRIPQPLHLQLIRQGIQPYEFKERRMRRFELLVRQAAGVDPLFEELEVVDPDFGEMDAIGEGFGEAVLAAPGCAEEGRGGGENIAVDREGGLRLANLDGGELFVEGAGW